MNLVLATQKISKCIDSATTPQHHKVINKMINNLERYCNKQVRWDKTVKGAIALLNWQNAYKFNKTKFGRMD